MPYRSPGEIQSRRLPTRAHSESLTILLGVGLIAALACFALCAVLGDREVLGLGTGVWMLLGTLVVPPVGAWLGWQSLRYVYRKASNGVFAIQGSVLVLPDGRRFEQHQLRASMRMWVSTRYFKGASSGQRGHHYQIRILVEADHDAFLVVLPQKPDASWGVVEEPRGQDTMDIPSYELWLSDFVVFAQWLGCLDAKHEVPSDPTSPQWWKGGVINVWKGATGIVTLLLVFYGLKTFL